MVRKRKFWIVKGSGHSWIKKVDTGLRPLRLNCKFINYFMNVYKKLLIISTQQIYKLSTSGVSTIVGPLLRIRGRVLKSEIISLPKVLTD